MPSLPRLDRLAALAALPAVGGILSSAVSSKTVRDLVGRGVRDPRGLVRHLAKPSTSIDLIRRVGGDPSVRKLARASLLFMPMRYWAIGQAAIWSARKVVRRLALGSPAGPRAPLSRVSRRQKEPQGSGVAGKGSDPRGITQRH